MAGAAGLYNPPELRGDPLPKGTAQQAWHNESKCVCVKPIKRTSE